MATVTAGGMCSANMAPSAAPSRSPKRPTCRILRSIGSATRSPTNGRLHRPLVAEQHRQPAAARAHRARNAQREHALTGRARAVPEKARPSRSSRATTAVKQVDRSPPRPRTSRGQPPPLLEHAGRSLVPAEAQPRLSRIRRSAGQRGDDDAPVARRPGASVDEHHHRDAAPVQAARCRSARCERLTVAVSCARDLRNTSGSGARGSRRARSRDRGL